MLHKYPSPPCAENARFCRIQRVPGRAGSGVEGSSRAIDRTSARRRPPCQSCGDEGDDRHTALLGVDGITVSEGDGWGRTRASACATRSLWMAEPKYQPSAMATSASMAPKMSARRAHSSLLVPIAAHAAKATKIAITSTTTTTPHPGACHERRSAVDSAVLVDEDWQTLRSLLSAGRPDGDVELCDRQQRYGWPAEEHEGLDVMRGRRRWCWRLIWGHHQAG
jgi:hypothetical protein